MRIIGGRDYYDSGLAYGQDESLIFLRNGDRKFHEDEIEAAVGLNDRVINATLRGNATDPRYRGYRNPGFHTLESFDYKSCRYDVNGGHVVLCGVLYNAIWIRKSKINSALPGEEKWFWTDDALRQYAEEHDLALDEGQPRIAIRYAHPKSREVTVQTLEEWLTPVKLTGEAREFLVRERITIAHRIGWANGSYSGRSDKMTWNIDSDGLKEMDFAKAVDPYTAFQEISMWLGGVIPRNGPPMVEITDDKIKIAKAGFHHPTSFRKPKEN